MPTDRPAKKAAATTKSTIHEGRATQSKPVNPQNPNDLQVTSADAWGTHAPTVEEGFVTSLPSGNVVRMTRTLDLPELLATGRIPNPLASVVKEMMSKGITEFPPTEDLDTVEQLMELLNATFCKAVLEPRFTHPGPRKHSEEMDSYLARVEAWQAPEGSVAVYNVLLQDKLFVFAVAQGAAADLARFREQPGSDIFSLPAGEDMGVAS